MVSALRVFLGGGAAFGDGFFNLEAVDGVSGHEDSESFDLAGPFGTHSEVFGDLVERPAAAVGARGSTHSPRRILDSCSVIHLSASTFLAKLLVAHRPSMNTRASHGLGRFRLRMWPIPRLLVWVRLPALGSVGSSAPCVGPSLAFLWLFRHEKGSQISGRTRKGL